MDNEPLQVGDKYSYGGVTHKVIGFFAHKGIVYVGLETMGKGRLTLQTESTLLAEFTKADDYSWVKSSALLSDADRKEFFMVSADGIEMVWHLDSGKYAHIDHWASKYGKLHPLLSFSGTEIK